MILIGSSTEALQQRRRHVLDNGTVYWRSPFIRTEPEDGRPSPTAFLVEQEPNSTILPHFHQANQFQVVVAGGGRLGKHPVRAVSVHYANAHTPYGPIRAEADGLHYFTLRDDFDPGARFMPGARPELKPVRRRHALSEPVTPLAAAERAAPPNGSPVPVLTPEADGLGGWLFRLPPDGTARGPDPKDGGGQYHLVVSGSLRHADAVLPRLSCIFVSSEDDAPSMAAGPDGLELLVLQFPKAAPREG